MRVAIAGAGNVGLFIANDLVGAGGEDPQDGGGEDQGGFFHGGLSSLSLLTWETAPGFQRLRH